MYNPVIQEGKIATKNTDLALVARAPRQVNLIVKRASPLRVAVTFWARLRAPGLPIRQRNLEKENTEREREERERRRRRRTRAARCKGGSNKREREGKSGRNGKASEATGQRDTGACHSHQSAAVCVRRRGARWTRTAAVDLSTFAAVNLTREADTRSDSASSAGEKKPLRAP